MTPKGGHMSRLTMAKPKPSVVNNVSTKRHASMTNKTPVQKQSLRVPPPRPSKERPRPGSLPTVVPKVESRRPSPKPVMLPTVNMMTKVESPRPLAKPVMMPVANQTASSMGRSFSEKTVVLKPLKIVQRLKEGKLIAQCLPSVRSTQAMTINKAPHQPSYVPRTLVYRSSVSVMAASKRKQDMMIKVFTTGLRNPGIARQKPSVNIGTTKIARSIKVTETSVKKPVVAVASGCRTGTPTWRLTPPKSIASPYAVKPASHVAWSPPPSPDLSSFPSQSWTIVVDVDAKRIGTPTKICGDNSETLSSTCDAAVSSGTGRPEDSCERSESVSCSPASSSSPTVVETQASPAKPKIGSDGTVKISTPTKEPSAEVSHTVCAATIISPLRNGTASMDTVAKVVDRSHALSPTKVSDSGNRTRTMDHRALETVRTLFSPSRRTPQSATEPADLNWMGTTASRIRKVFIPPLSKDAKASKNPMTQMDIEMLRAWSTPGSPWFSRCGGDCHQAEDVRFGQSRSSLKRRDG